MEATTLIETQEGPHTRSEFKNLWSCQRIIRDWTNHPEWEAYDVLPTLFAALHTGEKKFPGSNSSPKLAETVRNSTSFLPGSPSNLLAPAENVYLLTSRYTTKLDEILKQKPKTLTQAIEDAAFAYYVFDRIHPFPDGNGRIGRMIVKRVLQGAGVKDLLFHDRSWYGAGRSEHKIALEKVDDTNNLSHLELYFAESLIKIYNPINELFKYHELSRFISTRRKNKGTASKNLTDIWNGFTGLPMYGVTPTS